MRKNLVVGSVVLTVLFALVLGCGKKDDTAPPASSSAGSQDFSLTAVEFGKEFKADQKAAEAKYKGKVIEVRGSVYSVGRDKDKRGVILFATEDEDRSDVLCACRFADRNIAASIGDGQTVRVKGRFSENERGPVLTDCEIVEKGPDTLITITAEQLAKEYTTDPAVLKEKLKRKPLLVTGVVSAVKTNTNFTIAELTGDGTTVIEVRDAGDDEWPAEFKVGARVRFSAQLHPLKCQPGVCGVLLGNLLDEK